jgi:endonuclease/exonuclease/phosphatase family metal-dependent hydrolase
MMSIFFHIFLILGLSLKLSAQQIPQKSLNVCADPSNQIQIATYNILSRQTWKSQWLGNYPPWEQRMTSIAAWVKKKNLDILGTQEGLIEMINQLKVELPDYQVLGKPRSQDEKVGELSAIFINKNRFDVLSSGDFWLSKTPDVPGSQSWDSKYPRICTWAELKNKKDNSRLFVFNAHYDHLGSYSRVQSTKIILDQVKKIAGSEKVIVMGDFNVEVDSSALALYKEFLLEAKDSSKSRPTGRPRSFFYGTIDHVFISPKMITCSYEIMEPKSPDHKHLSDHLPVVVKIAP